MNDNESEDARLRADELLARTGVYYTRNAGHWTKAKTDSFFHEDEFRIFMDLLSPLDAKVVDLGCAGGLHVPMFLGMGHQLHYTGVDLSRSFIGIAKDRYPQLPFFEGDLTEGDSLPKQDFDAFWCAATFMHVPTVYMPLAAKNIASICRPGAIGYITLPKKHPSGEHAAKDRRHFEIMQPDEQRLLIASFGWKIRYETEKGGLHSPGVWQAYIVELP